MQIKTLIVSAFDGNFGNYRKNTSELVARKLNGTMFAGYGVMSVIFPCTIPSKTENRGDLLLTVAKAHQASGILSLGMSSASTGFWFETRARNELHQPKYYPNKERVPVDTTRLLNEVLHFELMPWNFEVFKTEWESRHICPAELSSDKGSFCCEHLAYQVLAKQSAQQPHERLPFTFIHLPCCPEAVKDPMVFLRTGKTLLTTEAVERGLRELLTFAKLPVR